MSELLAGEVNEGQVVEAGGDRGVVLDEGPPAGVLREQLVDPRVVTQHTAVSSEGQAAQITPANRTRDRRQTSSAAVRPAPPPQPAGLPHDSRQQNNKRRNYLFICSFFISKTCKIKEKTQIYFTLKCVHSLL